MTNELSVLVPGNRPALCVAPDKPGNFLKKEKIAFLESVSWLRRRSDRKPYLIHQTKKI